MGYREDLRIDKYDLDEECVDHSLRYDKWGAAHVEADIKREKLERRIKVIEAEVDDDVRTNPSKYGWNDDRPPTEPFVKASVRRSSRVRNAYKLYYRAKARAGKLKVGVRAFEHRKQNLTDLCGLHNKSYYSRPYQPPKHSREEKEKLDKEATAVQEDSLEQWAQEEKIYDKGDN
jgi:hypothetical protein